MKLKKLVSALVSGAMILGTMAAVPVFAEETDNTLIEVSDSNTLKAAVNNIAENGTIKFTNEITVTRDGGNDPGVITFTKNCTVDLNGQTLNTGELVWFAGSEAVTFTSSAENGTIKFGNITDSVFRPNENGSFSIENITFTQTENAEVCYLFNMNGENSSINLKNCVLDNINTASYGGVICGNNSVNTKASIENCQITNINGVAVFGGQVTVKDSTISAITPFKIARDNHYAVLSGKTTIAGDNNKYNENKIYTIGEDVTVDSRIPTTVPAATIGTTPYATLAAALDAAQDSDTITLLADAVTEASYQPAEEKGINIDLGGNKLTFNYGANYFKGSNTISNGTVDISNIENPQCIFGLGMYDTTQDTVLTFNNVNLIGNNVKSGYAVFQIGNNGKNDKLIFNGGSVDIALRADDSYGGFVKGGTSSASVEFNNTDITLKDTHMTFVNTNVTLNNGTEMTVSGENVDYVFNSGNPNGKTVNINSGSSLKADNVDVTKSRGLDFNLNNGNLTATGDTYINDSSNFDLTNNSTLIAECNVNVAKITTDETSTASVKTADSVKATFVNTDNPNVYDIYIYGGSNGSQTINRFTAADFTFNLDVTEGAINYEISSNTDAKIELTPKNNNRYMFHMDGVNVDTLSGGKIKIGQVTFTGYGKFSFGIADVDTNEVHATKAVDSIVNTYIVGGNTANNEGELIIDNTLLANKELAVPTKTLTINIKFPNAVSDNANAYQSMNVTIAGGTTNETIKLGSGADETAMMDGAYKIERDLPENTPYTVTVSGAGYRTARYTVNLNADKTLNFWNNVMDDDTYVEAGTGTPSKTNFLAGDIVKDNNINIYDLSAVVSYFGETGLINGSGDANAYAKYDLNRDGVIDSKDVAYVLVSWGK